MRALTPDEAQIFVTEYQLGERLALLPREGVHTESTADIGRRCAYAKVLTNHLITSEDSIAVLDITDWDAWESSQNLDLFYSYRRYLGENRLLHQAHFHVFTALEANEFRNILHLALISLFDVSGASTTTDFRFYASNDEGIDLLYRDGDDWVESMQYFFARKP
jgi:hypothetical protein